MTNVPVDSALEAIKRAVNHISTDDLPLAKSDYMKLVTLNVRFGGFSFNSEEYKQHRGLTMGSPLSVIMASLYMEMLESDRYKG